LFVPFRSLKELVSKVPEFFGDFASEAGNRTPSDTNYTRLRLASAWQAIVTNFGSLNQVLNRFV
jgi:hypothetical protein